MPEEHLILGEHLSVDDEVQRELYFEIECEEVEVFTAAGCSQWFFASAVEVELSRLEAFYALYLLENGEVLDATGHIFVKGVAAGCRGLHAKFQQTP